MIIYIVDITQKSLKFMMITLTSLEFLKSQFYL